jgi:hypothetical protein
MIQGLIGLLGNSKLLLIAIVLMAVGILFFGIAGLLTFLFLPRLLLAIGIAIVGFLFIFQKIPIVGGAYSWIAALICWFVAYLVGTGWVGL